MKIGELLVEKKLITWAQLEEALDAKRYYGGRLGSNLVEMGFISEDQLALCLSEQLEVPYVRPEEVAAIPMEIIDRVPRALAERYRVVPLRVYKHELYVAVADPSLVDQIDELGFALNTRIRTLIITEVTLNYALERYYGVPRPVRLLAVPGGERADAGGVGGGAAIPAQGSSPSVPWPAAAGRPAHATPGAMPSAQKSSPAMPAAQKSSPAMRAATREPLRPLPPLTPASLQRAVLQAASPTPVNVPIPTQGTSLADSPHAAEVLPIVRRAERLPVAPPPRPPLPPARMPSSSGATRMSAESRDRDPVGALAEAMVDADVMRAVLAHLTRLFERVVMLGFQGGGAVGVCAAGVSATQKDIETIHVPVAPWSLLHEASMSPRLIHEEQTQDSAVVLACKAAGVIPGFLTLIPIHEGRRAVYCAIAQGRDLGWVQAHLVELKSFLHKVSCALQIVSLRSEILADE